MQKDGNAVRGALDQLNEAGWAKKWSSQPYVSRRTVSLPLQSVKFWESATDSKQIIKEEHKAN